MPSNVAPIKPEMDCEPLKKLIREVPDFPKPGILFYDITTLLKDRRGFAMLIDALAEHYISKDVDLVLGMEARGFIFAPALAYRLNAGFVPVRQPGKNVLIVDDLLATGGTAEATTKLASSLGAKIAGLGFVVELDFLNGRDKLKGYDVFSLLHYDR